MNQGRYLIDELCSLTGFSRRTIRYYVQNGLVDPPAGRGRGGYYSDAHVGQLARIRELQEQGYRLEAIRGMIARPSEPSMPSAPAEKADEALMSAVSEYCAAPPASRHTETPRDAWTRYAVAPGVELHLSIDAERRLGSAVGTALETLRSVIEREGGPDG